LLAHAPPPPDRPPFGGCSLPDHEGSPWPAAGAAALAAAVAAAGWGSASDRGNNGGGGSSSSSGGPTSVGFVNGVDLNDAAVRWVPPWMRRRAFGCEPFDEAAALHSLQAQYAVVVATKATASAGRGRETTAAAGALYLALTAPSSNDDKDCDDGGHSGRGNEVHLEDQEQEEYEEEEEEYEKEEEEEEEHVDENETVEIGLLQAGDALAAAALAVDAHAALAQSLPAVRRFWKHVRAAHRPGVATD
jgi:hypothetical protein